jgi:3-hydroxymyristoyl/3-hydroxydecanoyl-(acyl carrier protein) dehydratase
MFADGHRIVMFQGMTMKLTGMDRSALEQFWAAHSPGATAPHQEDRQTTSEDIVFTREQIVEFALGAPSKAFGAAYRAFDQDRFIARLPGPPFTFIDGITRIEPPPWVLAPGGWVDAICNVAPDDWYFRSNGAPFIPVCILMEIPLQICGFLAAYMGSALQSNRDLHFRNLDGTINLHGNIHAQDGPVRSRAKLVQTSSAGDIIIQHYAFEVYQAGKMICAGTTVFGFFTPEALANQVGLPESDCPSPEDQQEASSFGSPIKLLDTAPLTPDDPETLPTGMGMPSRALRMIDHIDHFSSDGGPHGLGYVRGSKTVDPAEWFFKAHFHQDPVCPGSLGIESFVQLLRFAADALWPGLAATHTFELMTPARHIWRYRGQIVPSNQRVEVEAMITERRDKPQPMLKADGYLKCDGLYIYKMQDFALRLVPRQNP